VDDLTKKLAASKKLCDRLQHRLRAKWEAKQEDKREANGDSEIASREEIEVWLQAGKGSVIFNEDKKDWKISPNKRLGWLPATRANLKF